MGVVKVYLEPTFKCNLHCKFCYVGDMQDTSTLQNHVFETQDKESLKNAIHTVFFSSKEYIHDIDILGGEPTLAKNLDFMISYISSNFKVRRFTLTSNATTYTKEKIENLKRLGINEFRISLHGLKDTHNSLVGVEVFERVIQSIQIFKNLSIPYTLIYVINQKNKEDILPLLEYLSDEDILPAGIFFEFVEFSGYALENIEVLNLIYSRKTAENMNNTFTKMREKYPRIGMAFTNYPKCILNKAFHEKIDDTIEKGERYELYIPGLVRKSFFGFSYTDERNLLKEHLKNRYKVNFQSLLSDNVIPDKCGSCEYKKDCYLLKKETILFEYLGKNFLKRKHYFEINKKLSPGE